MRLYRLRFLVIGLLLRVFHVWCRTTCGTDFTDPASSAYRADVVLIGKVLQKNPVDQSFYKVVVKIERRGVLKGEDILKAGRKGRTNEVTVNKFGMTEDSERCIGSVEQGTVYMFFLNTTTSANGYINHGYFNNSAMVIPTKKIKKSKKLVGKILKCKKAPHCAVGPVVNPKRQLKDRTVKFQRTLQLKCSLKGRPLPNPLFQWYKDGHELNSTNLKSGMSIRDSKRSSKLKIRKVMLSDDGTYQCLSRNVAGEVMQQSVISVVGAPPKKRPCDTKDRKYCLNNGTCEILVELDRKMCTCQTNYGGKRCEVFRIVATEGPALDGENKLAQDRTLIVVGIISGILLFIVICVSSYFLAKRRRERFYDRQREKKRCEKKDNIPQVYRPLFGCDDVDGNRKHRYSGVIIHKETQTTETCFLDASKGDDKLNLYINPLENYIRPDRKDNNSRSRLTAVSLEGVPAPRPSSQSDAGRITPDGKPDDSPEERVPEKVDRPRIPSHPKPGNPDPVVRDKTQRYSNPRYELGKDVPLPPSLNLESDSEGDTTAEDTPLTPLHISEDEDDVGSKRGHGGKGGPSSFNNKRPYPNGVSKSGVPPSYDRAVADDEKLYASTSSSGYSDSSTPTSSGEDSQDGRFPPYLVRTVDPPPERRYWNERGSPEHRPSPNFFAPARDKARDNVPPPPAPDFRDRRAPQKYGNNPNHSPKRYPPGAGMADRRDIRKIRDVRTDKPPVQL